MMNWPAGATIQKTSIEVNPMHKKSPSSIDDGLKNIPGDDLLSHDLAVIVSSALESLTSVFGMGTGVTPPV